LVGRRTPAQRIEPQPLGVEIELATNESMEPAGIDRVRAAQDRDAAGVAGPAKEYESSRRRIGEVGQLVESEVASVGGRVDAVAERRRLAAT
jgi:hypothetical protein